jgi:5-methyltetrahydrofolate--homocysteine methyltransferase
VVEGEEEKAASLVGEAMKAGVPVLDILNQGVVAGIKKTGELWRRTSISCPTSSSPRMPSKPAWPYSSPGSQKECDGTQAKKFVIGVVAGDMHDLGKSLVVALLKSASFSVIDLGIDVSKERFVEAVREHKPAVLGLGAYMSTTMLEIEGVIQEISAKGMREGLKIMVGGVPTSQEFPKR